MANPALVLALLIAGLLLTLAVVVGLIALAVWLVVKLVICIAAFIGAALAGSIVAIIALVLVVLALALLGWFVFAVHRLPLVLIGLGKLTSIAAIPFRVSELPGTVVRLGLRRKQMEQAVAGLSKRFTIGGRTADGYTFMFGADGDDSYTKLSATEPEQFSMAWTTFGGVEQRAAPLLSLWSATLTDKEVATAQFWPTIATYGLSYNLIILEKVSPARADGFKSDLGAVWSDEMQALQAAGELFVIDMTFFARFPVASVAGFPRFTPATLTFLKRQAGALVPFAIRVSGENGAGLQHFVKADAAWLYALQAAKTSITVWGIWLGHVWHWHIPTAAMQMTMFQTLGARHIVRQLFGRQSKYLIAFDQFLLLAWQIAPPTSLDTSAQFLRMMDAFAAGRPFFADDPKTALETLGLRQEDFTQTAPWDQYPVVRNLLTLWDAAERYVGTVVDANYTSDQDVANDAHLRAWIAASGDPAQGNIQGLPAMDTKAALERVLTSLIYRITAHGTSRMNQAANPALTFVANFPPCLQNPQIPSPTEAIEGPSLFAYLPNTGSMGSLTNFLFTFIFSTPYESFIPLAGVEADLSFTGANALACNTALIQFRRDLEKFIDLWAQEAKVQGVPAQVHQWELNIET
ncbi:MAG TPA: lipoxygenase family protein [Xanthobacteraceae bacterium]